MENLASLILFFVSGFAVALFAGWLYTEAAKRARKQAEPSAGAVLRIRAASGMYRSKVLHVGKSVWTISAPLQRDCYVPFRVGEEVVIEAAAKRGALVFRSVIVARDAETHELMIDRPAEVHEVERREHKRWPHLAGTKLQIDGMTAKILDLAQGGARLEVSSRLHRGDRLRVDTPWGQTLFAWVLDAEPGQVRVRFEELVELRPSKRETAPAL
jgi:hypothetical protein